MVICKLVFNSIQLRGGSLEISSSGTKTTQKAVKRPMETTVNNGGILVLENRQISVLALLTLRPDFVSQDNDVIVPLNGVIVISKSRQGLRFRYGTTFVFCLAASKTASKNKGNKKRR